MILKSERNHFCGVFIFGVVLLAGCAVPQHFWPQKDITASDIETIPGESTVLIASRSSAYKIKLVAELHEELSAAHISHRLIGIQQLGKVDATDSGEAMAFSKNSSQALVDRFRTALKKSRKMEPTTGYCPDTCRENWQDLVMETVAFPISMHTSTTFETPWS